jgi:DNA-binding CsgD family transcriptional regulator
MSNGGVESLARFPVLGDLVEALLMTGDERRAAAFAREHARIAGGLGRPWALALAARSAAMVADARGRDRAAIAAFQRALAEHERQDRPLERARTLLAYGTFRRRRRQKLAARERLECAQAMFESAGAERWAERARAEIGRIGGRRAARPGTLSATEAAIATQVAAGRTNREVAAALHLSARTVEWNLSKLYRKLGLRSRTELARFLASEAGSADLPNPLDLAPLSPVKSADSPG